MLILLKFGKNSRNTIEVLSSLIAMNSATFEFLADFGIFFVLPWETLFWSSEEAWIELSQWKWA